MSKLNAFFLFLCVFIRFAVAESPDPNKELRIRLQNDLVDLAQPNWQTLPPRWNSAGGTALPAGFVNPTTVLFERYREKLKENSPWNSVAVWHQAGKISCMGTSGTSYLLGINIFIPQGPLRGTFFFVHGYLNHAGNFTYTLDQMTKNGWAVVTLDLPGHGLSSGIRADVVDFRDYGDAVAAMFSWAQGQTEKLPRPWVQSAHSLGCASSLEYYSRLPSVKPDFVVFFAPLVRTVWYDLSVFGYSVAGWAIKETEPVFSWDGYLGGYRFPTHWFGALSEWNKTFDKTPPFPFHGVIVQGLKDNVVDVPFNLPFLSKLLQGVQVVTLPDVDHLLLVSPNERENSVSILVSEIKKAGLWAQRQ